MPQAIAQRFMGSLKPRSISQLTIVGFLAVTGILLVALIVTARQLDGLSDQSRRIISRTAEAMSAGRTLIEQSSAMERNARQYGILGDPEILSVYADRRQTFTEAAQQISRLELNPELVAVLNELVRNEAVNYRILTDDSDSGAGSSYPRLLESSYEVADLINIWTTNQLGTIETRARETQRLLTLQAVVLISIALLLAALFTALITRPLLQIEKSINQLGDGEYDRVIRINGPRDLINLGSRLEWLRNRLDKLEQQRSSFLRHVSHELKTPLASMQESASLLRDGVVGELNEEQRKIIDIQKNNCQRLQALIDDLLKYNSESFSVLNAMPQPVRLDRVVEKVIKAHELSLSGNGLTVDMKLERQSVQGDPEQIRVIVDNLLTNAIKFSPRHGVITVRIQEDEQSVRLDVRDQGCGIDKSERERVFEAFYQGRTVEGESMPGSGLGLAIVQEYIHANAGKIQILDSAGGAHFRVNLKPAG